MRLDAAIDAFITDWKADVVFCLDDGERLEFDRVELLSSLGTAIAGDMGRLRAA